MVYDISGGVRLSGRVLARGAQTLEVIPQYHAANKGSAATVLG